MANPPFLSFLLTKKVILLDCLVLYVSPQKRGLDYHILAGAIFGLALFFTGIFGWDWRAPPFFGHDSAVDTMKSTLQIGSFEAQTNNSDTGYS